MPLRLMAALSCCALLGGCFTPAWQKKAVRPEILGFKPMNEVAGTRRPPRLIGHVAMVNTAGNFVLLECEAWDAPSEGMAMKTFRYGAETGVLTAGKERRGNYVVADVVKGSPERGDEVFQ